MSIPASRIVNVNPAVLSAGGSSLVMNGLVLTQNAQMPTGVVYDFASPSAVSRFFGANSAEAAAAVIYFKGFDKSTIKPGGMLFAAYNAAARAAFLQSGSLAGVTLVQLQALSGVLTISVEGVPETSSAINLAPASSFSDAAAIIAAGFGNPGFAVTWNAVASAFVITTTATGANATLSFATGSLAGGLKLASTSGAILSQGAVADTPASAMSNVVANSQNFATVVTLFEPSLSDKQAFAAWFDAANDAYLWAAWDSDANASLQGNETCFGYLAKQAQWNGVAAISGDPALAQAQGTTLGTLALNVALFLAGAIASINFTRANGRTTAAFLAQSGIAATVADDQVAQNLLANGYNFYGAYATRNQGFTFFYNGQMPGDYAWIDSYINQIWINSQMQLALLTLQTQVGDVSYDATGYSMMRSALMDPIAAGLSFGAIRTGVTLSADEIAEVNQAAGMDAASQIQTQGYYLQIADPGAQVRAQRGSPSCMFWYADGQSVQSIDLSSTNIQ